jgi:hypothetical protein
MLFAAFCAGCTQTATDSVADSVDSDDETVSVEKTVSYASGHGVTDPSELSGFIAALQDNGYSWQETELTDIPQDTDALILCAPDEDLTAEELEAVDAYLEEGGHILLFMPASGETIRYKYLERLLEEFCVAADYDIITETDTTRTLEDDDSWIELDYVSSPDTMTAYSSDTEKTPYLRNARSFHFIYRENFGSIKMDAMIETADTAVGTPYGGTEDDPVGYEDEKLVTMLYARDEERLNATLVAVGGSNFLTDAEFSSESSASMLAWVYSSLDWFLTLES